MKREPKIIPAPTLAAALGNLLENPSCYRIGVMGNIRIAVKLASEGYNVFCPVVDKSEARSLNLKSLENDSTQQSGKLEPIYCNHLDLPIKSCRLDAFFTIGVLGGHKNKNVGETVESWSRIVRPGGIMAIAELAAEGFFGRFMLRLARGIRGRPTSLDPSVLCRLLLQAGAGDIHQIWPQGIGSWVLTYGKMSSLRDLKPNHPDQKKKIKT